MAIDMNALRAKAMEKKTEKPPEFIPIDLNEGNVQAIFNRCLKTDETKNFENVILYTTDFGFEKTENPIVFDKDVIQKNVRTIKFLYGQLALVHECQFSITCETGNTKYDKTLWTKNSGILKELFYLGGGAHIMSPFIAKGQKAGLIKLSATLSPKDPNFPAWWEAHKGEWEV